MNNDSSKMIALAVEKANMLSLVQLSMISNQPIQVSVKGVAVGVARVSWAERRNVYFTRYAYLGVPTVECACFTEFLWFSMPQDPDNFVSYPKPVHL